MREVASEVNGLVAERVRELRAARRLSLDALASKSGVSRSMISLIERGESSPTAVVLEKLAARSGRDAGLAVRCAGRRAAARQRPGGAARRPAAVAGPGLGLPCGATSRRRACRSRCRSSRCSFPPGGRVAFETGARDAARAPAGVGARRRDRRHAGRGAPPAARRAIAWPCSSTARRCSTTRRESRRAMPW